MNTILFKKNFANRSFFMSERASERDAKKTSDLLIYHEQPEWVAHSRSFVLSNLSESLTVAHLIRAI